MEGYKCINCGVLKEMGDIVYIIEGEDNIDYPMCSEECVEEYKFHKIDLLVKEMAKIRDSKVSKELW